MSFRAYPTMPAAGLTGFQPGRPSVLMPQMPYSGYGAALGRQQPDLLKPPVIAGGRRAFGGLQFCTVLLLPWILGICTFTALSFSLNYWHAALANVIFFVCLGVAIGAVLFAAIKLFQEGGGASAWLWVLGFACLVLVAAAAVAGERNYRSNMRPFYDVNTLSTYPSVDPLKISGNQLMDAGQIQFTPGTHIDITKSMGFKDSTLYCVAPIIPANGTLGFYDFWAVGTNCCGGHSEMVADFHCGEYANAAATSGLRLMQDELRPFFRLAVQQAEAAFNIRAPHPIFLEWMRDPSIEVSAFQDVGMRFFMIFILGSLAWQLAIAVCSYMLLTKLRH